MRPGDYVRSLPAAPLRYPIAGRVEQVTALDGTVWLTVSRDDLGAETVPAAYFERVTMAPRNDGVTTRTTTHDPRT